MNLKDHIVKNKKSEYDIRATTVINDIANPRTIEFLDKLLTLDKYDKILIARVDLKMPISEAILSSRGKLLSFRDDFMKVRMNDMSKDIYLEMTAMNKMEIYKIKCIAEELNHVCKMPRSTVEYRPVYLDRNEDRGSRILRSNNSDGDLPDSDDYIGWHP